MTNFVEFHRAIGVLLGRYSRRNKTQRLTLNGFVDYLRNDCAVKRYFRPFGRANLYFTVSNSLRTGAYEDFALSKGEGIVMRGGYQKQVHSSEFTPTVNQVKRLGL